MSRIPSHGLAQLVLTSNQDVPLIGNPEITFFKSKVHRYSPFSLDNCEKSAVVNNGGVCEIPIPIVGDMVTHMYLSIQLPDVDSGGDRGGDRDGDRNRDGDRGGNRTTDTVQEIIFDRIVAERYVPISNLNTQIVTSPPTTIRTGNVEYTYQTKIGVADYVYRMYTVNVVSSMISSVHGVVEGALFYDKKNFDIYKSTFDNFFNETIAPYGKKRVLTFQAMNDCLRYINSVIHGFLFGIGVPDFFINTLSHDEQSLTTTGDQAWYRSDKVSKRIDIINRLIDIRTQLFELLKLYKSVFIDAEKVIDPENILPVIDSTIAQCVTNNLEIDPASYGEMVKSYLLKTISIRAIIDITSPNNVSSIWLAAQNTVNVDLAAAESVADNSAATATDYDALKTIYEAISAYIAAATGGGSFDSGASFDSDLDSLISRLQSRRKYMWPNSKNVLFPSQTTCYEYYLNQKMSTLYNIYRDSYGPDPVLLNSIIGSWEQKVVDILDQTTKTGPFFDFIRLELMCHTFDDRGPNVILSRHLTVTETERLRRMTLSPAEQIVAGQLMGWEEFNVYARTNEIVLSELCDCEHEWTDASEQYVKRMSFLPFVGQQSIVRTAFEKVRISQVAVVGVTTKTPTSINELYVKTYKVDNTPVKLGVYGGELVFKNGALCRKVGKESQIPILTTQQAAPFANSQFLSPSQPTKQEMYASIDSLFTKEYNKTYVDNYGSSSAVQICVSGGVIVTPSPGSSHRVSYDVRWIELQPGTRIDCYYFENFIYMAGYVTNNTKSVKRFVPNYRRPIKSCRVRGGVGDDTTLAYDVVLRFDVGNNVIDDDEIAIRLFKLRWLYNNDFSRLRDSSQSVSNTPKTLINNLKLPKKWRWKANIGMWLIESCDLVLGDDVVDSVTGETIYTYSRLFVSPSHRRGFDRMCGEVPELTEMAHRHLAFKTTVPLPFGILMSGGGKGLPIIALTHANARLRIRIRDFAESILPDWADNTLPNIKQWKLELSTVGALLGLEEREKVIRHQHLILYNRTTIRRHQSVVGPIMRLSTAKPVSDIFLMMFRTATHQLIPTLPITHAGLKVNGTVLTDFPKSSKTGRPEKLWFTARASLDYASSDHNILIFPFAIFPTHKTPSGSLNFSVLNDPLVRLYPSTISDYTCVVITRSWEMLRVLGGQGGVAYQ